MMLVARRVPTVRAGTSGTADRHCVHAAHGGSVIAKILIQTHSLIQEKGIADSGGEMGRKISLITCTYQLKVESEHKGRENFSLQNQFRWKCVPTTLLATIDTGAGLSVLIRCRGHGVCVEVPGNS